jgi:hypothetical protein
MKTMALVLLVAFICVATLNLFVISAVGKAGGLRCVVYTIWEGKTPEGCPRV